MNDELLRAKLAIAEREMSRSRDLRWFWGAMAVLLTALAAWLGRVAARMADGPGTAVEAGGLGALGGFTRAVALGLTALFGGLALLSWWKLLTAPGRGR